MRPSVNVQVRSGLKLVALGLMAFSVSACSQTDRFAYDPFSNPFNGKEMTGSVSSAPAGSVNSQPLPPPGGYQPASTSAPAFAPQRSTQTSPQPYRQGGYQTAQQTRPSAAPQYSYSPQRGGWGAEGGQTVVVQQGDTAYSLGSRHGVPASAILQANNLPPGAGLTAGQRIVIPGYRGNQQAASNDRPQAAKPRPVKSARNGGSHTVRPGETLFSISRTYNVPARELAEMNNVGLDHRVRIGEQISVPGAANVQTATHRPRDPEPARMQTAALQTNPNPMRAHDQFASAPQQPREPEAVRAAPQAAAVASGGTDFRWPVRGRVISGFGAKPNGQTNDGINISVPEGAEIKAAEGGVVAYAGNELKGFGNLVLIRHAGEWVTAYAHASEILVKRGDVVRRGQTVARAGKTGNVNAPQLHFEVRRGASPVDPMNHLPQG